MKSFEINFDALRNAGIPEKFWKLGDDTYPGDMEALRQSCKYLSKSHFALSEGFGLLFYGEHCSAKTYLLCRTLKHLLLEGHEVLYVTLDQLADILLNRERIFDDYFKAPAFLAVDNIRFNENKGWQIAFSRLVTLRNDWKKPLLLGSSLDPDSIGQQYTEVLRKYLMSEIVEVPCHMEAEPMQMKRSNLRAILEHRPMASIVDSQPKKRRAH